MQELNKLKRESKFVDKVKKIGKEMKPMMIKIYHKLKEANTISDELNRRITFVPFISDSNELDSPSISGSSQVTPKVKVINKEQGWYNLWSIEKFEERLEIMRDLVEHFSETGEYRIDPELDPFYDEKQLFLFGVLKIDLGKLETENSIEKEFHLRGTEGDVGKVFINFSFKEEEEGIKMRISFENIEFFDLEGLQNQSAYFKIKAKEISSLRNLKT